jgi:hypothetical protein
MGLPPAETRMKNRMALVRTRSLTLAGSMLVISATCFVAQAQEDEQIYYGSRAGMHLTTISKEGIGTAHAIIRVKHTPKDAKAVCVEYSQDYSMACVKRTMAEVKVKDRVTANCVKRTWTDMYGSQYRFLGPAKKSDEIMADYSIKDLKTGETLDGSSASGYGVELTIFQQLCPGIAK